MFGFGTIIKALSVVVVVLTIAMGLYYVSNMQAQLAIAVENEKKLQDGIDSQNQVIERMKVDFESIQRANSELQAQNSKLRADQTALENKFSNKDFGARSAAAPKAAEKVINRGTKNALRCLELASGAPLNDAEKSAKTPLEANRECPTLIDPNYTPID